MLISLGEQKSKQRAVTSKTTAGHAKFKLYPYKSTFEIAIKIKIKREKYMEDRVCTLHLFFFFSASVIQYIVLEVRFAYSAAKKGAIGSDK